MSTVSFMTIDFGSIRSYNTNRGFGFVGRTFFNPKGKVFFHIKNLRRQHPELAQKLDNGEAFETINFWHEIETTEKGEQVSKLWVNAENIPQNYTHELCNLIQKVEYIWKSVGSPIPSWLDLVTIDLVGLDRRHELSTERDNLENQLKTAEEEQRRKENEIGRIAREHQLKRPEASELYQLLADMRPLNFRYSKQLSEYIVKQQLGSKYQHISGILRMREAGTEWDFRGGFPPKIYAILCKELKLDNQRTPAVPVKFTPFKDIHRTDQA